ncbi:MAG: arylesterase [Hyphomicrobiaceae bacterium]|jgi:acyl-CoA thioesterase-1
MTRVHMVTRLLLFNVLLFAMCAFPASSKPASTLRIVAFGDSLTAGFMLPPESSFPAQLERALKAKGHAVEIVNAGVSGDTTGAALERFDWAFGEPADAAIVELGANDALRGQSPGIARRNLDEILTRLGNKQIAVLVAGMTAPRNWGPAYVQEFEAIFPDLARKHDALLYPFFLDGVALDASLNLPDGLHPNARGIAAIVSRILPQVETLIARARSRRAAN